MIGVLAGAGRVAMTNAIRQVGRQFGREAMQRILGGEAIETVLTREEMRTLAKRIGRVAFGDLMRQGREELMNDTNTQQQELNERMNNFTRNLNEKFRENTTLYKEERNIQNKNKIEDRLGLSNAYNSLSGLYKTGNTLYISGTGGKDGSITRDILDDLLHLPTRNAHNTEKYKDVMEELKKSPNISRLVGHSLASAVINKINEEQPNRFSSTTYATPTIKPRRKGKQNPRRLDFRNPGDVVSVLDGYAVTSDYKGLNPLIQHSYLQFEGQGLYHIRPTTHISNGIHVNSPLQTEKKIS